LVGLPAQQQQIGALLLGGDADALDQRMRDRDRSRQPDFALGIALLISDIVKLGAHLPRLGQAIAQGVIGRHDDDAHQLHAPALVLRDRAGEWQQLR